MLRDKNEKHQSQINLHTVNITAHGLHLYKLQKTRTKNSMNNYVNCVCKISLMIFGPPISFLYFEILHPYLYICQLKLSLIWICWLIQSESVLLLIFTYWSTKHLQVLYTCYMWYSRNISPKYLYKFTHSFVKDKQQKERKKKLKTNVKNQESVRSIKFLHNPSYKADISAYSFDLNTKWESLWQPFAGSLPMGHHLFLFCA